jgi:hypothetical protein
MDADSFPIPQLENERGRLRFFSISEVRDAPIADTGRTRIRTKKTRYKVGDDGSISTAPCDAVSNYLSGIFRLD